MKKNSSVLYKSVLSTAIAGALVALNSTNLLAEEAAEQLAGLALERLVQPGADLAKRLAAHARRDGLERSEAAGHVSQQVLGQRAAVFGHVGEHRLDDDVRELGEVCAVLVCF